MAEHEEPLQQPPAPERFDHVLELIREHGSALKIPTELLVEVGYVRHPDGTLAPLERGYEPPRTLEQKNEEKPFDPITVEVPGARTTRRITFEGLLRLDELSENINTKNYWVRQIYKYGDSDDRIRVLVDPAGPLIARHLQRAVFDEMATYNPMVDPLPGSMDLTERAERGFLAGLSVVDALKTTFPEPEPGEHHAYRLTDMFDDMPGSRQEYADYLSSLIQYERSRMCDVTTLRTIFDTYQFGENTLLTDTNSYHWNELEAYLDGTEAEDVGVTDPQDYDAIEQATDALVQEHLVQLAEQDITTQAQLIKHTLGSYLERTYPQLASGDKSLLDEAMALGGSEAVVQWLGVLQAKLAEQARADLKAAKKAYANTPATDTEEKRLANDRFNAAKVNLRSAGSSLQGIIENFNRPVEAARTLQKQFDKMQDVLLGGSDTMTATITMDASINARIDADPGRISGDCTEGLPLPFLNPNNDLYNVKLFSAQQHIGNIYLLQVKNDDKQPVAWHLDAIQIPMYADWDIAAPKIIQALLGAAQAKGVETITINGERHHISNYDYIAEAFVKHSTNLENEELENRIRKAAKRTNVSNSELDTGTQQHTQMQIHSTHDLRKIILS